jgi:hypothetical protein
MSTNNLSAEPVSSREVLIEENLTELAFECGGVCLLIIDPQV